VITDADASSEVFCKIDLNMYWIEVIVFLLYLFISFIFIFNLFYVLLSK
jgi:hypothetical protein